MSATPQKITASNRWNLIEAATDALKLISKASGYNTSPLVTRDPRKVKDADEKFVVQVEDGSETMIDGRITELQIIVSGYARVEPTDDPVRVRNMLLQDVRTALVGDKGAWRNNAGVGAAITLDRCEVDGGLFLDAGWVVFEQNVSVKYPQGSIW
jgi:hypothetical protein